MVVLAGNSRDIRGSPDKAETTVTTRADLCRGGVFGGDLLRGGDLRRGIVFLILFYGAQRTTGC
jgi:hypothetical protein